MLVSALVKIALSNPMEIYLQKPGFYRGKTEEAITVTRRKNAFFCQSRNEFIKERLMVVTEEHEAKPLSDFVDDKVVLQKECSEEKICIICGASNDATYRLCKVDGCIGSLVWKELNISR